MAFGTHSGLTPTTINGNLTTPVTESQITCEIYTISKTERTPTPARASSPVAPTVLSGVHAFITWRVLQDKKGTVKEQHNC